MKKLLSSLGALTLLCSLLTLIASCASIINGQQNAGKQEVTVISSPPDATITVDGVSGTGRVQLALTRTQEHLIEIKREGYKTVHITTANSVEGSYYVNLGLLPLGVIGEIIDMATGAAYSIKPRAVIISLDKGDGIVEEPATDSTEPGLLLGVLASVAILAICVVFL